MTTQERTPAFAFVPDMPGDVILGHLYYWQAAESVGQGTHLSSGYLH